MLLVAPFMFTCSGELTDLVSSSVTIARFTAGNNDLTGEFVAEIGSITQLEVIWIYNNGLTGNIPDEIENLTGLLALDLVGNEMSGALPTNVVSIEGLLVLNLGENGFDGEIPAEYANFVALETLNIEECSLSGAIPDLSTLQTLQVLRLGGNDFTEAPLPAFFFDMTGLTDLRLESSNLVGGLDGAIGNLVNLERLSLEDNALDAELPDAMSNLVNMEVLTLQANQFIGALFDISGMVNLREINLSFNFGINGPIPDFSAFTALERIEFQGCKLTGTLDDAITTLANLRTLMFRPYARSR